MEKLPMCRICLAENGRMYKVVNRKLHELYEKLTDNPFVTEDSRPILACIFCYAKLKKCYQLLRQCLKAEELFTQRMNENYEPNPLINQNCLELSRGFIISPIEHTSLNDVSQSIVIKQEELPAVFEGLDDVIEPKKEHRSYELKVENLDNSCLDVADIPPHHSESDLEDDKLLMEFKTEVEDVEVSKKKQRGRDTLKLKLENLDNSCLDVADIPPHHSESDLEDDKLLTEFKTEVEDEEVSKKEQRGRDTKRATVEKKPKPDTQRTKLEDAITGEQTKKEKTNSKVIWTTQKRTSKAGTCFKEPYKYYQSNLNQIKKKIQHTDKQIGEKPKCNVCQLSFSRKSYLKDHIRIHAGENPYKCDICQSSFSDKHNLSRHIRIHTGEKPYKCDVCQLTFNQKSNLTVHNRIHTGEKPYKCDICPHSFSKSSSLTKHIRIHTGEKPYKCDVCQSTFNQKGHLTQHIRIHTGEKPFKCHVCQHTFNQKSYLTKHTRIHTGEKPYKCDICQHTFIQKSNLTKHKCIHTREKPYKCDTHINTV